MPKIKKSKYSENSYESYIVLPQHWDHCYSFGLNHSKHSDYIYSEYNYITVLGTLALPPIPKIENVHLHFNFERDLIKPNDDNVTKQSIGYVETHDNTLKGYITLPQEYSTILVSLLQQKLIPSISLYGNTLKYRRALIRNIRISTELDEELLESNI